MTSYRSLNMVDFRSMISIMSSNGMSKLLPGFESHQLGDAFENSKITAFFGHRGADSAALQSSFPDFTLSSLKQTHSDHVVSAASVIRSGEPVDADAQFTAAPDHKISFSIAPAHVSLFDLQTQLRV